MRASSVRSFIFIARASSLASAPSPAFYSASVNLVRTRKPAIVFIFITLVLDIIGIGIVVPILPKLVEQFQQATS